MAENQEILWWGVSVKSPEDCDPVIFQGIEDLPIRWYSERILCSRFLSLMLFYQAANGGLSACGSSFLSKTIRYSFTKHGWTSHGKLNGVKIYARQGQVVCHMPPGPLPWMMYGSITAGAESQESLESLGAELGLELE